MLRVLRDDASTVSCARITSPDSRQLGAGFSMPTGRFMFPYT
jgi:hypothetical protein